MMTKRIGLLILVVAALLGPWLGRPLLAQTPAGRVIISNHAGTAVTVTGTALDVTCTGCTFAANQSGTWTIQATHQAGEWNVRHVGTQVHAAVTVVRSFGPQGTDVVGLAHAALRVFQPVTGKTLLRHAGVVAVTTGSHILNGTDGKRIYVYAYSIQSRNDSTSAQFVDNKVAHVTLRWMFNTREGTSVQPVSPPGYLFATSPGNALQIHVTGTVGNQMDYDISYWVEE